MRNRVQGILLIVILTVAMSTSIVLNGGFLPVSSPPPATAVNVEPLHMVRAAVDGSGPAGLSPKQIRTVYGLPSSGGVGATIAIICAFNTSTVWNDLTVFSTTYGLPTPTNSNFEVYNMSASIPRDSNWTMEACLDVEWAHAIAPDAKILLVQAVSNSAIDLLAAVDYARSRPDVVSISMSWGCEEFSGEAVFDSYFSSSYGAVFFAGSGDASVPLWPAVSPNVVSVGGTIIYWNPNFTGGEATFNFERGWERSGGGVSQFEPKPDYQTNFGINVSKRAVPDVSFSAVNFPVYCEASWTTCDGTSFGSPQWAAIHALGRSASHVNFYNAAKANYSAYFRDIIYGVSGGYVAGKGYDYVTGLGSPLTINFASAPEPTPSPSTLPTATPTPSPTPDPSPHPTATPTPNPTPLPTPTLTPTPTTTATPMPTSTPIPTPSSTADPSPTDTPTPTATPTPVNPNPTPSSNSMTPKPAEPTQTTKPSPSPTPTQAPSASPPNQPSPAPSDSPVPDTASDVLTREWFIISASVFVVVLALFAAKKARSRMKTHSIT